MITTRTSGKIAKEHLCREAIVYIRQSNPYQVRDNRESGERQYNLVERATALGWPAGSIKTVDEDQGAPRRRRPPPRFQEAPGRDQRRAGRDRPGAGGLAVGPLLRRLASPGRDLWDHQDTAGGPHRRLRPA